MRELTDEQRMEIAESMVLQIKQQRADILRAFIAKFGYEPDEYLAQVQDGNVWKIEKITPAQAEIMRRRACMLYAQSQVFKDVQTVIKGLCARSSDDGIEYFATPSEGLHAAVMRLRKAFNI